MVDVMSLYLDDSGTRNPDRHPGDALPAHGHDWFALGGVLVRDSEQGIVEQAHDSFCKRWPITGPLHSSEVRASSGNFTWVGTMPKAERERFLSQLGTLATLPQLVALACVVDRPGYNARYLGQYGRKRWSLCRTAFNVVVKRAAKYARREGCRLRVFVERSDKKTDARLKGYYQALREVGSPFNGGTSAKYAPLSASELRHTLYDFKTKNKSSRLTQLADLCLWPVCIGGYDESNRAYVAMRKAGTLIESRLQPDEMVREGTKYSCWELQQNKTPKPD